MSEMTAAAQTRKSALVYTLGSLLYYFTQWLMTIIVVKTSGFEMAGLLSLAMNVTSAPAIAALFSVRSYQVSDLEGQFSNRTYVISRFFTCSFAVVLCLGISLANHYSTEKIVAIMSFMLFKLVESFTDVFIGIEQKNNRLDLAGISLFVRGIIIVIVFFVILSQNGNLVTANLSIAVSSLLIVFIIDYRFSRRLLSETDGNRSVSLRAVFQLLLICLPLACVAFLNNFSFTIPKLILEKRHGQAVLGIYNSLSSPTLVIQLVASTLFAPLIPILTGFYNKRAKAEFNRTCFRFIKLMAVLSVICIGTVLAFDATGLLKTFLVTLYAEELGSYTGLFLSICILSILIAVNACLFGICTLMRLIKSQLLIGVVGVAAAYGFSLLLIPEQSIQGTIIALIDATICQILVQIMIIRRGYCQLKNNRNERQN